jgi:hypothetical protein
MTFRVDFNNIAGGGRLKASLRRASPNRIPAIGERVCLHDAEGNACWAWIDEVREPIVLLKPDWDSWSAARSR